MKISELCGMLEKVRVEHGDLRVYCGLVPAGGLAVLPVSAVVGTAGLYVASPVSKVVSIIIKPT